MKKLLVLSFITFLIISCKTKEPIASDLTEVSFYTYDNQPISLADIKIKWRKMINDDDDSPLKNRLGKLEIREVIEESNGDNVLALLALNNSQRIQTASILTEYKNGYKLSDRSVTCADCGTDLQVVFKGENWVCKQEDHSYTSCTKTSRLEY